MSGLLQKNGVDVAQLSIVASNCDLKKYTGKLLCLRI